MNEHLQDQIGKKIIDGKMLIDIGPRGGLVMRPVRLYTVIFEKRLGGRDGYRDYQDMLESIVHWASTHSNDYYECTAVSCKHAAKLFLDAQDVETLKNAMDKNLVVISAPDDWWQSCDPFGGDGPLIRLDNDPLAFDISELQAASWREVMDAEDGQEPVPTDDPRHWAYRGGAGHIEEMEQLERKKPLKDRKPLWESRLKTKETA